MRTSATSSISTILPVWRNRPSTRSPPERPAKTPEVFWTDAGVDVNEIDINKEPPSREFLEKHIDADRFLDFVSTRSPVFKERPLPKSKKEAIDLMMENPNLIRRPILIKGSRVIFGFDKDKLRAKL